MESFLILSILKLSLKEIFTPYTWIILVTLRKLIETLERERGERKRDKVGDIESEKENAR